MNVQKISVISIAYNEENRISNFLDGLVWCDDIVIVIKKSNDRTREICLDRGCKVIDVDYSDTGVAGLASAMSEIKHEWFMVMVVSDLIESSLVRYLTSYPIDQSCNTLRLPFKNYILGLNKPGSPWYTETKPYLFRKNTVSISTTVHNEIKYDTENVSTISSENGYVYHLTHQSVSSQFERHLRYAQAEALQLKEQNLKPKILLMRMIKVFVKYLPLLFRGRESRVLFFGYFTYYVMQYLYYWELSTPSIIEKYTSISKSIIDEYSNFDSY